MATPMEMRNELLAQKIIKGLERRKNVKGAFYAYPEVAFLQGL